MVWFRAGIRGTSLSKYDNDDTRYRLTSNHDTITYEYCEVVAIAKNLSFLNAVDAVNVFINFGEGKTYTPENPMKDENGNKLIFTSHIDCFNYLGTKGWIMITSNAYQDKATMTQRSIIHYDFKRPKFRK